LEHLAPEFLGWAPDLRGYGQADPALTINPSDGVAIWAKDLECFYADMQHKPRAMDVAHKGTSPLPTKVILVGHSLGALIAMEVMARAVIPVAKVILYAPPPPSGYPARGVDPKFMRALEEKDYPTVQQVVRALFWHPEFHHPKEKEIIEAVFDMHLGPEAYPEATIAAIAPEQNQTLETRLLQLETKPPIEWVRGEADVLVTNHGYNAPQAAMIDQMQMFLERYQHAGGSYEQRVYPHCGHSPFLEIEAEASLLCRGGSL
jgi:pimeloyl-ACP methyl ester carboxylesterase